MLDSRLRRLLGGVALAAVLLWPAGGVAFAATSDCAVTVQPASGPPGTQFTLKGNGYTATGFILSRGKTTKSLTVDLAGADPWTYSFVAADSDVGRWKVTAEVGDSTCTGVANIHVTLPSTSTLDPATPTDRTPEIAALAGLIIVFVFSAGLLFRRSRRLI